MAQPTSIGQEHEAQIRRPADLAGARDALLAAHELDTSVLVCGGATKLGWGAALAVDRPLLTVDTRRLAGLVSHDPGDMTATVQAGMPLDDLNARLAAEGQELAVDPPRRGSGTSPEPDTSSTDPPRPAGGPTVGGIVASNDAGPRRFRYGGVRDLVIGSTVVLADGTVARSGGTVIKNVAGYDLGKLWCGSLGTLGLLVELTVRLHPLPAARRTVRIPASAASATALVTDLLASPIECAAVEWASPEPALLVSLEGRVAGLAGQLDGLTALAHRHGLAAEPVDSDEHIWDVWREAHAGAGVPEPSVARAATLPGDLAGAMGDLAGAARGTDVEAAMYSHAGLGLHDAVLTGGTAAEHAHLVAAWRERIGERGGSVVLRERRAGVADHVDPWGPPQSPGQLALMRAVKSALDPDGRMAPGRFMGGI